MRLLSIETSCDETAAAIVESSDNKQYVNLISHSLATSLPQHATTGGIIPENAARAQIQYIIPTIYEALEKARLMKKGVTRVEEPADAQRNRVERASAGGNKRQDPEIPDIDGIAVTYGPGLIGSLLVGVETAKTLSYIWNKPLIPVNHLFGHVYANWINTSSLRETIGDEALSNTKFQTPAFPAIALIVSGGHTDLLLIKSHSDITWLGGTRDDAAGECFDKCARLLGYNYPGGPKIAQLAEKGNPKAFPFPRPMTGTYDFEFSFSGLKTAFINATRQYFPILRTTDGKIGWQQILLENDLSEKDKQTVYDLCASLQQAIIDILVKKTLTAAEKFGAKSVVLGGGVTANQTLKQAFQNILDMKYKILHAKIFVPPKFLCTDNAAMIGAAAIFRNQTSNWQNLSANPQLYFDEKLIKHSKHGIVPL